MLLFCDHGLLGRQDTSEEKWRQYFSRRCNVMKDNGCDIEVIFVSSDRSTEEMKAYMFEAHGDWLAVPFGDPLVNTLKQKYGVSGIPMLVVVNKEGVELTKDGRGDIMKEGPMAFATWTAAVK